MRLALVVRCKRKKKKKRAECNRFNSSKIRLQTKRKTIKKRNNREKMDEKTIRIIITMTPMVINFILLNFRKKKWIRNKYKWYLFVTFATVSFYMFFVDYEISSTNEKLLEWAWMTPLVFSLVDFIFMKLSFSIHNRDFYLWLRGSSEIVEKKLSGGPHVRASDRFFSMFLLFFTFCLPFLILFFI